MKEKIEQLAKGYMSYELPNIVLSCEKLSMPVMLGKRASASVTVKNEADAHMKGLVYSTDPRVTVVTNQFVGGENPVEFYCNAKSASVGEKISGQLCFVTDCGEITLPYVFTVIPPEIKSVGGPIRNMVQFAALARNNQAEAKRLFLSDDFDDFLEYYEPGSVLLRERLLKSPSSSVALEEFLVGTHKKMKVDIDSSEQEKTYNVGFSSFSDSIKIIKSNWGYISLNVAASASFIEVETESISNEDFIGQEYDLKYVIYPERMAPGVNNCTITISGCGVTKTIAISCRLPHEDKVKIEEERRKNRLLIRLTENYLAYAMNKIPAGRFVSEAKALLDRLELIESSDHLLIRLYRAYLIRISGKESPAWAILNNISDEELAHATPLSKGLYFRLCAARNEEDRQTYMSQLYTLIEVNEDDDFLRLLLLITEEKYKKNPRLCFDELKSMYEHGSRNAIMLFMAAELLNREPLLLKDLDSFEVNAVFFALKWDYCCRDTAAQFTSLVLRARSYTKVYYNILSKIYERFQLKDTLTAICQLLIKGYRKESRYFKWYQKGVEENIRISDLYEYYMYSLDRDIEENLDQTVLMYYVYNSKLNDRKLAYLYANIVLHKDSNPIVYENYREKLRMFANQQMRDGKNNKILSIIYNDCLCDDKAAGSFSEFLYKVIFRHELTCTNPLMRYVCVVHKELDDEVVVPLIGGQAQVDIFTDDAVVFALDAANNRYCLDEAELKLTRLISDDTLANIAYQTARDKYQLTLFLAEKAHKMRRFDAASLDLRKQVTALPGINEVSRNAYISELVLYYYDHSQEEISDEDLKKLDYQHLPSARRGKFIGLLILREQYDLAYKMMSECGFMDVDARLLEKYVLSLQPAQLNRYDKLHLDIIYYLFKSGRRNERILIYLVSFFNGLTQSLFDIWQEAVIAKCATSDFDERLLVQILFTESYLPYGEQIYIHYHRRAGNRVLTKAYFNYLAYKYLVADVALTAVGVENMKKDAYFETNDIVILALLKHYAQVAELTKEEQDFARTWLDVMCSKGKILPCFTNFAKYFRLPEDMDDKIYIEYRSNPDHHITIMLASRSEGKKVVREEPMRNVCYGIFIKELVLFTQETIEYVITDDDGKNISGTEKQVITGKNDPMNKSRSRFARINAIINARNLKDKSAAVSLLNEYVKNEFAISQLFHEIS